VKPKLWEVDGTSRPGIVTMRLSGIIDEKEMAEFVLAHNAAIDALGKRDYRVFCDIRDLKPLSPVASDLLEKAKAYSAAHSNFRGSAVLVSSATVAMQHRRTSTSGGVMDTELISHDEAACWAHIATVQRPTKPQ
jgi:hypothetical protein